MGTATFKSSQIVCINNEPFNLLRKLPGELWQCEHSHTREFKQYKQSQLLQMFLDGNLIFLSVDSANSTNSYKTKEIALTLLEQLQPEEQEKTKKRYAYARAVIADRVSVLTDTGLQKTIENVARALKDKNPPHWCSVRRWVLRYEAAGRDIASLAGKSHLKGNHNRRYPSEVLRIVDEAIQKIYLTRERNTCRDVLDHAISDVARHNRLSPDLQQLPLPSLGLVKSAIRGLPAMDVTIMRYGREYAIRKYRSVKGHHIASRPLNSVQIDHTVLDVLVIDDKSGLPLGRPVFTLSIDTYSRCVHGYHIGFAPASYLSVAKCLKIGILPKLNLAGVNNKWDCHGVPEELHVDNGLEFHSESLEAACNALGITIIYCPRRRPWFKPHIERLLGTISRSLIHRIPGTTFSNIFEKDDYDPQKHAVVTLADLHAALNKWIVDYYHHAPHRTLGDTPEHMWNAGISDTEIPLPESADTLNILLNRVAKRRLTHKGIELHGLLYNSDEIQEIRRHLDFTDDIIVRYDEEDLARIYVEHPERHTQIPASALNQDYANGLTLWQHNLCKRYARERLKNRIDIIGLAEAKRAIRDIISGAIERKQLKAKLRKQVDERANETKKSELSGVDVSMSFSSNTGSIQRQPAANRARDLIRKRLQTGRVDLRLIHNDPTK